MTFNQQPLITEHCKNYVTLHHIFVAADLPLGLCITFHMLYKVYSFVCHLINGKFVVVTLRILPESNYNKLTINRWPQVVLVGE